MGTSECTGQGIDVARGAALRADDERMGQRVSLECVERLAEPRLGPEFLECLGPVDQRHVGDVGAPAQRSRDAPGVLGRYVDLEVDGKVRRALPRVAERADVVHEHAQPGRQRHRDRDDEHREQRCERLRAEPAQGVPRVLAVQGEVVLERAHRVHGRS